MFLLCLVLALLDAADAARRGKKKRASRELKMKRFWNLASLLALVAFGPVIAGFIYSLYADPATPAVMRATWRRTKERIVGFLGSEDEEVAAQHRKVA